LVVAVFAQDFRAFRERISSNPFKAPSSGDGSLHLDIVGLVVLFFYSLYAFYWWQAVLIVLGGIVLVRFIQVLGKNNRVVKRLF